MPPLQTPGTAYTNPKCYREADAHGGALTPPQNDTPAARSRFVGRFPRIVGQVRPPLQYKAYTIQTIAPLPRLAFSPKKPGGFCLNR